MRSNNPLRLASFRFALLYAGVFVISVAILFAVTYVSATQYAALDESNEIAEEYAAIQDEMHLVGEDRLATIVQNHMAQRKNVRAVYLLLDPAGRRVTGNIANVRRQIGQLTIRTEFDGIPTDVRAQGFQLQNGDYLLVGQETSALQKMKLVIARSFGVGLVATLILALIGGAIISAAMLRRVDAISRTAREIIGGNLKKRVPLRGTDDEFDELGATVNAMLDRIDDLVAGMRRVSGDIAHDLRTPLTRLRQRLEKARLSKDPEVLHAAFDAAIRNVDSILETFSAVLRIAQVEAGGNAVEPSAVNVSSLLNTIVEDFRPAAEDHGQVLIADVEKDLFLSADRELLMQMIANLIDNAIRHARPGAEIRVMGSRAAHGVELGVADTGPGIPDHEREKVLRPFYRLETSRTTEGSGLGLSLVAAIAKRHRARLTLLDNNPGLRVSLQFPSYSVPPESFALPS